MTQINLYVSPQPGDEKKQVRFSLNGITLNYLEAIWFLRTLNDCGLSDLSDTLNDTAKIT